MTTVYVVFAVQEGQGFINSAWTSQDAANKHAATLPHDDIRWRVRGVPLDEAPISDD